MKSFIRIIFALSIIICTSSIVSGQTPQAIPYQAVARDVDGNLISSQSISLRFSIVDQYIIPTVYYQETQTATTNVLGLFTANIGQGTAVVGIFYNINWSGGFAKYLKVEMDVTGGSNYVDMGSSPILSVPFALYSEKSGNGMPIGSDFGSTMYWNGAGWDNNTNLFNGGQNVGIGTSNPSTKLEVAGTTTTTNLTITGGAFPNYILQSDANGNANWTNPATIIGPEIDPQVGSVATNKIPKWNGSSLVDGSIYDNGKVGIGTNTPEFKLSLEDDGGILAKGAYNAGATLTTSGAGTRMIWYPRKGAFRAGIVNGDEWDEVNIGFASFAAGQGNRATGSNSTALGVGCHAAGDYSFAQGNGCGAYAYQAVAMGYNCNANGIRSIAMGDQSTAFHQSRAFGNSALATGTFTTALGNYLTASGDYSSALGNYVSTNGKEGAFIVGDNSTSTPMLSTINNSFKSRFAGGYSYYTDAAGTAANGMFLTGGKAGIGTSTPELKLTLDNDGGILAKGTFGTGASLTSSGTGVRMIWYPKKGAFRVGAAHNSDWDDINIGDYSVATGSGSEASGDYSTAIGASSSATEFNATAIGAANTASGSHSFAGGHNTLASGGSSSSLGSFTIASGEFSNAIGNGSTASGEYAITLGNYVTASGNYSTAIGNFVSTNNHDGAFIIGDNSTTTPMNSGADNGFRARFNGGYRFFTNTALSAGVYLNNGDGAWNNVCDRNKKENFTLVSAEEILIKVGAMPMTKWNYKAQDNSICHIGPMAQDFFAAFKLNGESDTSISTIDIDGINMAAIQALKARTDELKKATDKIEALTSALARLEQRVDALAKENATASAIQENK